MSDQSLRDALEKRLSTLPVMAYGNGYMVEALPKAELLGMLAAHPAEPAPVVTDEAVEAAASVVAEAASRHWESYSDEVRASLAHTWEARAREALEAAAPLLGPRPLLDREAVAKRLAGIIHDRQDQMIDGHIEDDADALADAVMELARPMPTREQIEAVVRKTIFAHFGTFTGAVTAITDDLVALLNGAES